MLSMDGGGFGGIGASCAVAAGSGCWNQLEAAGCVVRYDGVAGA